MLESVQWEYRVETFGSFFRSPKDEALESTLDEWGVEGWEVISVFKSSGGGSEKITVVAKRPLSQAARRRRSWESG